MRFAFAPLAAAMAIAFPVGAALADGGVNVRLPDQYPSADEAFYERFLHRLVTANVISSNCVGFGVGDGEWALITGAADHVADMLGLDVATYDDRFYRPAFALLDWPAACGKYGPDVLPVIELLIEMGGSPEPID